MNRKQNIISFGEALWDCLPNGKQPGGAPMNVALHLHRLGAPVRFVSRVGKDASGAELLSFLKSEGLNLELIQTDTDSPTGSVQVSLSEDGDASYEIKQPVAWDFIQYDPAMEIVAEDCLLVYSSLAARSETSRRTLLKLLELASFRAFDLNLRSPFFNQELVEKLGHKADLIKMNKDEFGLLKQWYKLDQAEEAEALEAVSKRFSCPMICITNGKKGALLFHEGITHHQFAFPTQVKDTIGAGDSFLAAFLKCLTEGGIPQECLEYACAAGAIVAGKEGANPVYTAEEINLMR